MLNVNSCQRKQASFWLMWISSLHLIQVPRETAGRGLETFMSCDWSNQGGNILDLIVELGVDLLCPKMFGKAAIRPEATVAFLIYTPCCWHILLSSGKYCSLPHENSLRVTNSSCFTLHLVWGSSHPPPCRPCFHPWASIIPCRSCFLCRHWPFRWCLSQRPWPAAPLGAIMDSVLIACWRTEAVLGRLIVDSLGSTAVCLCDCCSNAARLKNPPWMYLHICLQTQCK